MQTVETLNEGLKRGYRLTIAAKEIDAKIDQELKTIAPQVRMPGFRPGKVPANLVRKMHGPRLEAQALETAIQEGVQKLLSDNKIRPAMQPSVRLEEDHQPGKDAVVEVEVETLPDVPEASVDGLKLERLQVKATDEMVDAAVARMAEGQKSFDPAPKGRKAEKGDLLMIDFEGKVDGEPFEGGKGENMSIELGSGRLIPGFEDQLVGAKANDQRKVEVSFPDEYPVDYLKGKAATFDVTVNEVQVPRDAAPDDGFAKSMGLESLDQLRGLLKGQVEQELNGLTRTHMKRQLLDQLAAAHDFPVPETMVEAEFSQIWRQLDHEAGHEADPDAARAEMEAERDDYRRIAERRVRLGLLLSEIGQKNGVEVSNQEMNALIMQAAQQYRPEDRQRFVEYVRQDPMAAAQLRAPLYEDKVVDHIFSKAEITDRSVTREELEAAIEVEEEHVHGPGCGHDHDHDHKPAKKAAAKKKADKAEAVTEDKPAKKPAAKKAKADDAPAAKAEPKAKKAPAKKAK
ncbi:trigger factor [Sphingosinicella sp. YJ22]|uniref:trigger factor n=1 Tax=Sphingosinicella sp. YJ22 TaxID=1104780 RepID=UPI00140CF516|nr:trigger factor [Sphingosinicella sp. YJ22]